MVRRNSACKGWKTLSAQSVHRIRYAQALGNYHADLHNDAEGETSCRQLPSATGA
jgi:hypothetical protein